MKGEESFGLKASKEETGGGGGAVEGKETEAEMKQSHGGLSVDRSFRA